MTDQQIADAIRAAATKLAAATDIDDGLRTFADDILAALDAPTDPPVVVPPPVLPLQVSAEAGTNSVIVHWTVDGPLTNPVVGFTVGRNGRDSSGAGTWSTSDPASATQREFDKLLATPYMFTVTARYADKTSETATVVATPLTPDAPPPPAHTTTDLPLAPYKPMQYLGSQLGVNSIVFQPDTSLMGMALTGKQRGRQFDGVMSFCSRGSWDAMAAVDGVIEVAKAGGIVVYKIPFAPETEGDQLRQGQANAYAAQWTKLAKSYVASGMNLETTVFSLGWEFNGDWYAWSAAEANGGAAAFKACYQNMVKAFRAAGLDKVQFDFCGNKGPNHIEASYEDCFPGAEYAQIISVDQYDMWDSASTAAEWAAENTDAKMPTINGIQAMADKYGVQWAISECGPVHASYGGGDNPAYYGFLLDAVKDGKPAYWVTYNDRGAPDTLLHDMSDNPKTLALITARLAAW